MTAEGSKHTRLRHCALAALVFGMALGFPRQSAAIRYEYDALSRLQKVVYENGMTITYEHDAAGNIVRRDIGAIPLALGVGVLQNPYLTQFIDVHLIAARSLDPAQIRLQVAGERLPVTLLDAEANLWKGDYEIVGAGGPIEIEACATGFIGVEECVRSTLSARFIVAAAGGTVRSADEGMRLQVGPGALDRDAYVLILPIVAAPDRASNPTAPTTLRGHGADDALSCYRISPPGILSDLAGVEMSCAGLLAAGTRPEQIYIELLGHGPLPSVVDPQRGLVRASASQFGDFALRVGAAPMSRTADPRFLRVGPNVPNPFNPTTRIRFELQTGQHASVSVFDVRGRRVASLLDAEVPPGFTHVTWDGRDRHQAPVPSGVYFARVRSERATVSIRMVLVR